MPWASAAQQRWGHSSSGVKALGGPEAVHEWDSATNFSGLPEKSGGKVAKNWIGDAVKHPGALTQAARANGVSKRAEAEKESHSSNPSTRGRGALGLRFMKKGDLHQ